jgi:hypothetical protein
MPNIILATDKGQFTGRTVGSIIRREFGRKAYLRYSADQRDQLGMIVKDNPNTGSGWSANVLATAYWAAKADNA